MTAETTDYNLVLLQAKQAQFNAVAGARVGDYLLLPYGLVTRFTHDWGEDIQTGGGGGSYFLGNGYCDYSGSLDSGVSKADIEPTEETRLGQIWFFDKDISGAHRGVHFGIPFRVFRLKEGASTTGLPQIAAHEKKLLQEQAETVTLYNGNGHPYTVHLPELLIVTDHLNEVALEHIERNTGLTLKKCWSGYSTQPQKHSQITALLLTYNFRTDYYNNSTFRNTLKLTFVHH